MAELFISKTNELDEHEVKQTVCLYSVFLFSRQRENCFVIALALLKESDGFNRVRNN